MAMWPVFALLLALQGPSATPAVSPATLVGTWVGLQTWAIENPGPGAREEQEVTLTIEEVGGKLVGTMTPFFGGADGASFTDAEIVADRLQASARLGKPRAERPAESRNQPTNWKQAVEIRFRFQPDRNNLKGTADVELNGVSWIKFNYDLSRKRSRY